ncbi:MAG: carboxypeptidase regulatory-like domain-containing protein [Planctomycetaceae bacterium]|nr:carboxypeptidase regulatory-like domain-containing protein [Planctomycetaceae bacterium]
MLRLTKLTLSCFTLLVFLAACSPQGEDQPDTGLVRGMVTLDGEPVPGAVVDFAPESGRPSSGITDSEGRYELSYNPTTKGAKIGKHTVRISTHRYIENADGTTTEQKETIPAKYNANSTLTVEVKSGENDFPFSLDKE